MRFPSRLLAAAALGLPAVSQAGPSDYVYAPAVEYGEREIDFKQGTAKAKDALIDDVLPANLTLAEAELVLGGKMGRELTLKRAIREFAQDNLPNARFGGERTKLIVQPLTDALKKHAIADDKAAAAHAANIADLPIPWRQ